MAVSAGARLGPYEVVALLGAGGMGEVYRARDPRLGRDVAIKLVHPRFSADAEQLRRFEQEARAASQLDHPNILVVHDLGSHEGSPYIVSELLEGESLREKLGTPLPSKKAIEYAVQVAHGLAAAHEKGIVHRDLKPENLFVTKDGRVKILDFGIAKLVQPSIPSVSLTEAATAAPPTEPGVVMGTVSYMSPEQVQGKAVDQRSDLFSLGVILYEMLSGQRPFQKSTAAETMTAILREEPPELSQTNTAVSPGLERIVRHCLEKEPTGRFQTARDVAFALDSLSQTTTAGAAPLKAAGGRRRLVPALLAGLVVTTAAAVFSWVRSTSPPPTPTFKRLTFRRGTVGSGRFTLDYQSVVYCAGWEGKSREAFSQRLASADARPLGIKDACVYGVSAADVLAIRGDQTLLRQPIEGGSPRELVKEALDASWDRSGTRIAVEKDIGIEFPIGTVVVKRIGATEFGKLAVSPDGRRLAYPFYPRGGYPSGDFWLIDESGQRRTLLRGVSNFHDIAWAPDGKEIWFSAEGAGSASEIHAITLSGKRRLVARFPMRLNLQDVAPDGRVLVRVMRERNELRGRMAGDPAERDLSWLDGTCWQNLSPDGTQMVFGESKDGGGTSGSTYYWRLSDASPIRLSDGLPIAVSPDWTTVLVELGRGASSELKLVPIGAGEAKSLPRGSLRSFYNRGFLHPDGKRLFLNAAEEGAPAQVYVQELGGGLPKKFGELRSARALSQDGRFLLAREPNKPWCLYPVDGGEKVPLPPIKDGEWPVGLTEDAKGLFLRVNIPGYGGPSGFPMRVVRLDLKTGRRDPWLDLMPPDLAGAGDPRLAVTPNGRYYAYGYSRTLSDFYVVEGLR